MASLLYSLAGKLLKELCSPVFQNVGKSWGSGTKTELKKLKETLSAIEAVLLDAEEKQRTKREVQDWLMKIKLVFFDVEDLLLAFSTEALKRQVMTRYKEAKKVYILFSISNQVKYRLKMGRELKLIKERLDAIASDHIQFNLTEWKEDMHVRRSKRREETHSFVSLEEVIGRENDKNNVTKLLYESNAVEKVSVVSIVGIGGLGKTTLAKSIYSSEEVKGSFDPMIWIFVSDVFDAKLICENIIESVTQNKCEGLQMDVVRDKLKKIIFERKYLLVLDDVWSEDSFKWIELKELLNLGAEGSRILITTRSKLAAQAANSASYFLDFLSPKDSLSLFKQSVFK